MVEISVLLRNEACSASLSLEEVIQLCSLYNTENTLLLSEHTLLSSSHSSVQIEFIFSPFLLSNSVTFQGLKQKQWDLTILTFTWVMSSWKQWSTKLSIPSVSKKIFIAKLSFPMWFFNPPDELSFSCVTERYGTSPSKSLSLYYKLEAK